MIRPNADAIYEHMMELKEMMNRTHLQWKKRDLARKIRHLQRRHDELTKMPWELN